jgi:hypothetical protein
MQDSDNGEVKYVGTGWLQEKRPLVIATPYNIPFLLDVMGKGEVKNFVPVTSEFPPYVD